MNATTYSGLALFSNEHRFQRWILDTVCKGTGLVIYLALLAKVANIHYIVLTFFLKSGKKL